MARSHGKLLATIWQDPDWRGLSASAQRCYMLLLSQAQLSLAGVLDVMVERWASFAPDTTTADVKEALNELAAARFIIVDRETHELVLRSFARHNMTSNKNMAKGFWAAHGAILSPSLRTAILDDLDDGTWDLLADTAPVGTVRERPSERPSSRALERPSEQSTELLETGDWRLETGVTLADSVESARDRDLVWESVLTACGLDQGDLTESARGAANKAVKDLKAVNARPDEIALRASHYRQRWPDISLTPTALAKQWAQCATAPVNGKVARTRETIHQLADQLGMDR